MLRHGNIIEKKDQNGIDIPLSFSFFSSYFEQIIHCLFPLSFRDPLQSVWFSSLILYCVSRKTYSWHLSFLFFVILFQFNAGKKSVKRQVSGAKKKDEKYMKNKTIWNNICEHIRWNYVHTMCVRTFVLNVWIWIRYWHSSMASIQ